MRGEMEDLPKVGRGFSALPDTRIDGQHSLFHSTEAHTSKKVSCEWASECEDDCGWNSPSFISHSPQAFEVAKLLSPFHSLCNGSVCVSLASFQLNFPSIHFFLFTLYHWHAFNWFFLFKHAVQLRKGPLITGQIPSRFQQLQLPAFSDLPPLRHSSLPTSTFTRPLDVVFPCNNSVHLCTQHTDRATFPQSFHSSIPLIVDLYILGETLRHYPTIYFVGPHQNQTNNKNKTGSYVRSSLSKKIVRSVQ